MIRHISATPFALTTSLKDLLTGQCSAGKREVFQLIYINNRGMVTSIVGTSRLVIGGDTANIFCYA